MGTARKLQAEIDKTLKKVQEGSEVFDGIWLKLYEPDISPSQKEKFESELKKEIKKLQRFRDQIKSWIQSPDIKEKRQQLHDSRKLIETQMERFKVCEKETKTKAFSKEGLGAQQKLDPREKAKAEWRDWLNNMVAELGTQVEYLEAEMEGLQVKKGRQRPPKLVQLEDTASRNKEHIKMLESVLRLLENDELAPDEVAAIKDGVEDYVENSKANPSNYEDVEGIYESLPMEKFEALESMEAVPPVPASVVKEKATDKDKNKHSSSSASSSHGSAHSGIRNPAPAPAPEAEDDEPATEQVEESKTSEAPVKPAVARPIPAAPPAAARVQLARNASLAGKSKDEDLPAGKRGQPSLANMARAQSPVTQPSPESNPSPPVSRPMLTVPMSAIVAGTASASNSQVPPPPLADETAVKPPSAAASAQQSPIRGFAPPPPSTVMPAVGSFPGSGAGVRPLGGALKPEQQVLDGIGMAWRAPAPMSTIFQGQMAGEGPKGASKKFEIGPDHKHVFMHQYDLIQQQGVSAAVQAAAARPQQQKQQKQQQQLSDPASPLVQKQTNAGDGGDAGTVPPSPQSTDDSKAVGSHHAPAVQVPPESEQATAASYEMPPSQSQSQPQPQAQPIGLSQPLAQHLSQTQYQPQPQAQPQAQPQGQGQGQYQPQSQGLHPGLPQGLSASYLAGNPSLHFTVPSRGRDPVLSGEFLWGAPLPGPEAMVNLTLLKAGSRLFNRPAAPTPPYFPKSPLPILEDTRLRSKVEDESLLFAFYYQQDTNSQYYAAVELKKRSWRFHNKYSSWIRRKESGLHVFDYHMSPNDLKKGWCEQHSNLDVNSEQFIESEIEAEKF